MSADFEITTKEATEIGFNNMTLNAELTALDDIYDAAIVNFVYGQQPDLSDGIETETTGIFALNGTEGIEIDDLTEDTTYYFRAKAESVAYSSLASMDNATEKAGFMENLFANVTQGTKLLSSPHIIDTMWSKEMASQKFWEGVYQSSNNDGYWEFFDNEYGGKGYWLRDDAGVVGHIEFDLNFDYVDKILIEWSWESFSGSVAVEIDGVNVYSGGENQTKEIREIIVDKSGNKPIKIEYNDEYGSGNPDRGLKLYSIQLN